MNMLRRTFSKLVLSAFLALCGVGLYAQTYGSYTPYSIFGVGDIATPGNAYNKTMGGVGIAGRSNRFINPQNPAAVTARDSLAFMADFSLLQDNKIFRQGDLRSASNTFNISNLIISFPIWRSSAMMVGLLPYSGSDPVPVHRFNPAVTLISALVIVTCVVLFVLMTRG